MLYHIKEQAHLEGVENDIEFDIVLAPDRMIHLACICRQQQDGRRDDQQPHLEYRL